MSDPISSAIQIGQFAISVVKTGAAIAQWWDARQANRDQSASEGLGQGFHRQTPSDLLYVVATIGQWMFSLDVVNYGALPDARVAVRQAFKAADPECDDLGEDFDAMNELVQNAVVCGVVFCSECWPMHIWRGFGCGVFNELTWANPNNSNAFCADMDNSIAALKSQPHHWRLLKKSPSAIGKTDPDTVPNSKSTTKKIAAHWKEVVTQFEKHGFPQPLAPYDYVQISYWWFPFATWNGSSMYENEWHKVDAIAMYQLDPGRFLWAWTAGKHAKIQPGEALLLSGEPIDSLASWLEGLNGITFRVLKDNQLNYGNIKFSRSTRELLRKTTGNEHGITGSAFCIVHDQKLEAAHDQLVAQMNNLQLNRMSTQFTPPPLSNPPTYTETVQSPVSGGLGFPEKAGPPKRRALPKPPSTPLRIVRGTHDFSPESDEELAFNSGDIIEIIDDKAEDGWWKARLAGKTGLIPSTFVEDIAQETKAPEPNSTSNSLKPNETPLTKAAPSSPMSSQGISTPGASSATTTVSSDGSIPMNYKIDFKANDLGYFVAPEEKQSSASPAPVPEPSIQQPPPQPVYATQPNIQSPPIQQNWTQSPHPQQNWTQSPPPQQNWTQYSNTAPSYAYQPPMQQPYAQQYPQQQAYVPPSSPQQPPQQSPIQQLYAQQTQFVETTQGWVNHVGNGPPERELLHSREAEATVPREPVPAETAKPAVWNLNSPIIQPTIKTTFDHLKHVTAVAFSPIEDMLVSGCEDNKIRLWDCNIGVFKAILHEHTDTVTSLCYSTDGQVLVSGGEDSTVRFWDMRTNAALQKIDQKSMVKSVAVSPDGKTLAAGLLNNTVVIIDGRALSILHTLKGHKGVVNSVKFSPDGKTVASGSSDKTLRTWDPITGKSILNIKAHSGFLNSLESVAFSPNGSYLASGSFDKNVKIWNPSSGAAVRTLKNDMGIQSVAFSPGGNVVAASDNWGQITIWDIEGAELHKVTQGNTRSITDLCFSRDGRFIATGSNDKTAKVWSIR